MSEVDRVQERRWNELLVEMCTAYLLEEGITPPHPRTIFRILEAMPAKCQSHLAGINPYHQNGMEAFQWLKDMIPVFIRFGLDEEVAKDLEKAVNSSHYYFRSRALEP